MVYEAGTGGIEVSGPGTASSDPTNTPGAALAGKTLTGVGLDGRERRLLARRLDVLERLAGGEVRHLGLGGLGHGDDLGAVGEAARVLAKHGHLRHHLRELAHHQVLVGC